MTGPCPTCGHVKRAPRRRNGQEDRSGFPSLFSDHPASLPDYVTDAAIQRGADARATIASWNARRARGEYPVLVDGNRAEWRAA